MKILLVEDEKKSAAYIRKGLEESGFSVEHAANGIDGMHLIMTQEFDLLILDVMLPDLDGWSLLRTLRGSGKTLPVLMLTARDAVEDRVKGLNLGADDYLVKPFAFSELLARLRALLRRGAPNPADGPMRIADLTLDLARHKVARAGQPIDLSPKEMALLVLLIRHKGEVLTRTVIAEQVWDIHFDSDSNVVDVAIRRVRRKIDEPYAVKLIKTVRGAGYAIDER